MIDKKPGARLLPVFMAASLALPALSAAATEELQDWKNPAFETSSKLERQCQLNLELSLVGNSRRNYLKIIFQNPLKRPRVLHLKEIRTVFTDGRQRLSGSGYTEYIDDFTVGPQEQIEVESPYPAKLDFYDQDSMEIWIPVYDEHGKKECTIKTTLLRDSRISALSSSYLERSHWDLNFEMGFTLLRSSEIKQFSKSGLNLGVQSYWYGVHHGLFVGLTAQALTLPGQGPGLYSNAKLSQGFGAVGYSYRAFFNAKFKIHYDLAPAAVVSYFKGDTGSKTQTNLGLLQRAGFDYRVAHTLRAQSETDHCLGLSLYNVWTPTAKIAGLNAKGNHLGLLFHYKLGW